MYDIIIVGAGPAGSTLARLAATLNISIAIIDKRNLHLPCDGYREKACGGLLSPDAQKMLALLELSIPKSILEEPQFFKVRTIDFDNRIECNYQRHYLNMNREKFDRFLFQLIPDSVHFYCGSMVTGIETLNDVWNVTYTHDGSNKSIEGRLLVGADGANSFIRRHLFSTHPMPELYVSKQEWYSLHKDMPYFTGIFDSSLTDYYAWTIQKSNQIILGGAFPAHADVRDKMNQLREKTSQYLEIPFNNCLKTEGSLIFRTTHINQLLWSAQVNNCPVAFLGEAAGATSPTSAEGFSYAFKSALLLFQSLSQSFTSAGELYKKSCKSIEFNLILKRLKSPAMYNTRLRHWVMKSGLTALK